MENQDKQKSIFSNLNIVEIHKDNQMCPRCNHPMVDKKTLYKCNKCGAVIIKGNK